VTLPRDLSTLQADATADGRDRAVEAIAEEDSGTRASTSPVARLITSRASDEVAGVQPPAT
jgi:hypothetical protein